MSDKPQIEPRGGVGPLRLGMSTAEISERWYVDAKATGVTELGSGLAGVAFDGTLCAIILFPGHSPAVQATTVTGIGVGQPADRLSAVPPPTPDRSREGFTKTAYPDGLTVTVDTRTGLIEQVEVWTLDAQLIARRSIFAAIEAAVRRLDHEALEGFADDVHWQKLARPLESVYARLDTWAQRGALIEIAMSVSSSVAAIPLWRPHLLHFVRGLAEELPSPGTPLHIAVLAAVTSLDVLDGAPPFDQVARERYASDGAALRHRIGELIARA